VKLNSGKTFPYGFGWFLEHFKGQELRQHSGAWQGFTCYFIRYVEAGVSIAVFANRAGSNPGKIARGVAGLYDANLALPPGTPIEDDPQQTQKMRSLLDDLRAGTVKQRDFGGIFRDAPAEEFRAQCKKHRCKATNPPCQQISAAR
jgi:Beta-lactamase